jgi:hypothetical protein
MADPGRAPDQAGGWCHRERATLYLALAPSRRPAVHSETPHGTVAMEVPRYGGRGGGPNGNLPAAYLRRPMMPTRTARQPMNPLPCQPLTFDS